MNFNKEFILQGLGKNINTDKTEIKRNSKSHTHVIRGLREFIWTPDRKF